MDSIINAHPELEDRELPTGNRWLNYSEEIFAEIKNDSCDECYHYNFRFDIDELPEGLTAIEHDRSVEITGIPTENGAFEFKITVWVNRIEYDHDGNEQGIFYDEGHLTNDSAHKTYALVIR